MAEVSTGFETGVAGNNILTSDAGDPTAWDAINLGTGGTAVYDNALIHSGSLSAKLTRGSAGTVNLTWSTALGTVTDQYGRFYIYLVAIPAAAFACVLVRSGGTNCMAIRITTQGRFQVRESTGAEVGVSLAGIVGKWARVEWHVVNSTTAGEIEVKVFYNTDAVNPNETIRGTSLNTLASADRVIYQSDQNASYVVQFDDLVAGAAAWPGPTTPKKIRDIIGGKVVPSPR